MLTDPVCDNLSAVKSESLAAAVICYCNMPAVLSYILRGFFSKMRILKNVGYLVIVAGWSFRVHNPGH